MKNKLIIKNKPRTKLRLSTNVVLIAVIASTIVTGVSILLFAISLGISETALAEKGSSIYISILDGDWNTPSNWSSAKAGQIPGNKDDITVADSIVLEGDLNLQNELAVTIDADLTLEFLEIKNGAILNVEGKLRVDSLEFDNGSTITISSNACVIITGGFVNRNNSDNVTIDGEVIVGGDFYNGNKGVITGTGSISVGGDYLGSGTTFGISPNSSIAGGSRVPSTLPIDLIQFSAEQESDYVKLEWSTATEINNDYFTIERSTNGIDFEAIDYIRGAGNSNSKIDYGYIDNNAEEGLNYYRLTQTDFDGKFEQFKIKVVEFSNESDSKVTIDKIYPNPFTNYFKVEFLSSSNLEAEIILVDMNGITIRNEVSNSMAGYNIVNFENLSEIQKGYYFVYIIQNGVRTDAYKIMKK